MGENNNTQSNSEFRKKLFNFYLLTGFILLLILIGSKLVLVHFFKSGVSDFEDFYLIEDANKQASAYLKVIKH